MCQRRQALESASWEALANPTKPLRPRQQPPPGSWPRWRARRRGGRQRAPAGRTPAARPRFAQLIIRPIVTALWSARGLERPSARDCPLVVEPHQFDHGANVGVVRDAPRARPLLVGKDWMRVDAASFAQLAPELLRKQKMGGAVACR
jgi:hypothetical protein